MNSNDTTSVSVDSALQRAHKAVDARLPERSQQATQSGSETWRLCGDAIEPGGSAADDIVVGLRCVRASTVSVRDERSIGTQEG